MREDAHISLPDGRSLAATTSLPDKPPPVGGWPAVVVLHEAFGVAPDILAAADRFADNGWAAVVPNLFSRGTGIACLARAMRELATGEPGQITADIDATRAWLAARDDVDGQRLGVIGFCMGGGFALAYAATAPPGVRAASVNYGMVPKDEKALRRTCPVVASYGDRDLPMRSHATRLRQHLAALGIEHDVAVHAGAGHAFMTEGHHPIARLALFPLRIGYVQPAAEDTWERTFAFFDRHIAGESPQTGSATRTTTPS
ncbi:MAG: dienelactone hydrolase family protein [Kutzneria sp.]|nr:dienelactone hydrolase family protein [Kutzneria sp.]